MPELYLAGPLFSAAEISFNARLRESLAAYLTVYLPQEDGGLLRDLLEQGVPPIEARRMIFERDIQAIQSCHCLVIILDGRVIDEGASFELGFAYALGKECVGLKTDPRQLLASGDNPMVTGALSRVFGSVEDLLKWVRTKENSTKRSTAFLSGST